MCLEFIPKRRFQEFSFKDVEKDFKDILKKNKLVNRLNFFYFPIQMTL